LNPGSALSTSNTGYSSDDGVKRFTFQNGGYTLINGPSGGAVAFQVGGNTYMTFTEARMDMNAGMQCTYISVNGARIVYNTMSTTLTNNTGNTYPIPGGASTYFVNWPALVTISAVSDNGSGTSYAINHYFVQKTGGNWTCSAIGNFQQWSGGFYNHCNISASTGVAFFTSNTSGGTCNVLGTIKIERTGP
jgi:hypothetical protein